VDVIPSRILKNTQRFNDADESGGGGAIRWLKSKATCFDFTILFQNCPNCQQYGTVTSISGAECHEVAKNISVSMKEDISISIVTNYGLGDDGSISVRGRSSLSSLPRLSRLRGPICT
jgi:hypothetical protein